MPTPTVFRIQALDRQTSLEGLQLASFRSRALAMLVDGVIITLLLAVPSAWDIMQRQPSGSAELSLTLGGFAAFVLSVAYFGITTYLGKGRSPGKWLMGIQVVSLNHGHMSLWHCIERALGYAASSLEAGFGFVQYFIHPNRQTVHDRIAETIVIVAPRGKAQVKPH